jgi:2-C-methyl-D-erythritol 4-phosphate cytidylyltransferase/2-C-methyl-D-erythritol 2,4-cyclodiphosphate synthase
MATRQGSVRAGLEALAAFQPDIVLVHDAARPFASPDLIDRAIEAAGATGAAIPGVAVVDAVKRVDAASLVDNSGEPIAREQLRLVQTPQAFAFAPLLDAHRRAAAQGIDDFPDDAALASWAGIPVKIFAGEPGNLKLTTEDDFVRAEKTALASLNDIRMASGFDVHVFGPGDHVMLGGIRIPHERGLDGHSDADVVLHALTDAVLGALADGDIGSHFPPSEARWRGAASDQFLAFAAERVRERGGIIAMLDVTVLCEAPRIGPHRDSMRARIAEIAGIAVSRVAVKATTTEQLGFVGRSEGMAALATATVRLPEQDDD